MINPTNRVLILTNIPAPYRLPVFEQLAQHVALTVAFCESEDKERQWRVDLNGDRVNYHAFDAQPIRLTNGITFVRNPALGDWLSRHPFDVYIAGENFVNAPSVLAVMRAARRAKKPFILWSENIDTDFASGNF
ncbi:MAG: hypothetical protein KDD84_15280, partial [Caldilineaceae bacterium]|nr:hypothetical protein [Caldilineaceae bacterium]